MHSKFVLLAALSVGLLPMGVMAQAAPDAAAPAAPAPAAEAPAAPAAAEPAASAALPVRPAPQAYAAKIALVAFQQAVVQTNEGRTAMQKVQAKFQPKQDELIALNGEIEKLKKELQAAPAAGADAERAAKMKSLDSKEKQMDEKTQTARTAYQAELQESYGKIAEKVHKTLLDYVQANGYTIVFDVSNEQSSIIWAQTSPSADITLALIEAYNKESGVAAPAPMAAPAAAKPRTGTGAPHAAAKPAAK
ncbi:MAG TPA: OmpH family outer membrane protein [Acidobacteriaceae bacterium]|nr:OmpH family outer membrane protein [Acidobacteriaceae bacterium]